MRRLGFGVLFGIGGAITAAVLGYVLIMQFSANTHDRGLEAAMTSVFFLAPLGAVAGAVAGALIGGPARSSPGSNRP
jgi:hypothetical protein